MQTRTGQVWDGTRKDKDRSREWREKDKAGQRQNKNRRRTVKGYDKETE
jgi:hypothetical protein